MESKDHQQKMDAMGLTLRYMDPSQFSAFWDEREAIVKPLMALLTQ